MSQQDRPTRGQNQDPHTLRLSHLQSQEQIHKERSSDITMPSASSLSGPSPSLFHLEHDQEMYSPTSMMFGAEDHLLANPGSNADEGFLNNSNRHLWDRNSPWFAIGPMTGSMTASPGMVSFTTNSNRQTVNRGPNIHYPTWREAPASNPESLLSPVQAHNPFHSTPYRGTRSAISTADGFGDDGSMPGDLMDATTGMSLNANADSSIVHDRFSNFTSDADPFMPRSLAADFPVPTPVELPKKPLDRTGKNKPYFCNYLGCDRTEGFSSESDLDRHKRTKHGLPSSRRPNRSWRCQACQADGKGRNNSRVWLRLDNFRDHCRKSHRNQNIAELVARSELPEPGALIAQHTNLSVPLSLSEHSSARYIKAETGLLGSHLDQLAQRDDQSAKGKAPMQEHDSNVVLPSEEYWNPPCPTVRPHNLSIDSQSAEDTAMVLDETSLPLLSSASLFVNTNNSSRSGKREATPKANPESVREESEYIFSDAILDRFSAHLLGELTRKLNLDQSATDRAHLVITNSLRQLKQGEYDTSEESSISSSYTVESGSTPSQQVTKKFPCQDPGCTRSFIRKSELTKHAKRHTRPWTCIWPGCIAKKSFGSKADWKRHEGSTHWSRETYRCSEETIGHEKCTKEFARGDQYKVHLKKDHDIMDEEHLKRKVDEDRQVNPLPLEYLCGFCEEMKPIISDTEDAWNARFEHIERHFREGYGRAEWTARGKPIISNLNHEKNLTRQGLNQRNPVFAQEEISYDVGFDVISNGSSSGNSINNNNATRNQNNKNARTKNGCATDEECRSPSNKRHRPDELDDDECLVASTSVSRSRTNRY